MSGLGCMKCWVAGQAVGRSVVAGLVGGRLLVWGKGRGKRAEGKERGEREEKKREKKCFGWFRFFETKFLPFFGFLDKFLFLRVLSRDFDF